MSFRRTLNACKLGLRKVAPDLALIAGIAGGIVAVVEFCKKTREAIPVVDEYKSTATELVESNKIAPDTENQKALVQETVKAGVELIKIYAKPAAMYAVSTGLIIYGHASLKSRNKALIAMYAGVANELRLFGQRVAERYGDEAAFELKHGIKTVEDEVTRIDEKTGKEITEKVQRKVCSDPTGYSGYARFFDESCAGWKDDAEYNLEYLLDIQAECNEMLRRDGIFFLNQVYDKLDMKKTKAGQEVGWEFVPNGENEYGDNYIDFGLRDIWKPEVRDFVNGYNKVVLLDFNVDGKIIDSLPLR